MLLFLYQGYVMDYNRRVVIQNYAEYVLSDIMGSDVVFPVNVEGILTSMGFVIIEDASRSHSIIDCSGESMSNNCIIMPKLSGVSLLKECANVLGHIFIHMYYGDEKKWGTIKSYDCAVLSTTDEDDVAVFTNTLLMPSDDFLKHFMRQDFLLGDVASYFGVNVDDVFLRGWNLGMCDRGQND